MNAAPKDAIKAKRTAGKMRACSLGPSERSPLVQDGGGDEGPPPLSARVTTKALICLMVPFCMLLGGGAVLAAFFSMPTR